MRNHLTQLYKFKMLRKLFNFVGVSSMQGEQHQSTYLLFTYRSNIKKVLQTTYYDTDAGWGCMLRVGQMAIANYLYLYQRIPLKTILKYFWDNSDGPFSIQQLTYTSYKLFPYKKPYDWYKPSEMSFIIKDLIQSKFPSIHVEVFLDNSIFLQQIPRNYEKLLIIILIRIGLEEPQEIYLPTVDSLINSRYFFAALGGTPKYAHLFLKSAKSQIGYLDPHKTLKSAKTQQELQERQAEYVSKLSWIKSSKIDSSMAMIFNVGKQDIGGFWIQLQRIKQKHKQHFFIYMDKMRPEIEEDGMIEISNYQ